MPKPICNLIFTAVFSEGKGSSFEKAEQNLQAVVCDQAQQGRALREFFKAMENLEPSFVPGEDLQAETSKVLDKITKNAPSQGLGVVYLVRPYLMQDYISDLESLAFPSRVLASWRR